MAELSDYRAATVGIALAVLACSAESERPSSIMSSCSTASECPHIILLSLDTLRADHLSCYGYDRPTSPVIDAIAAESVRFEDVTSQSTATLPSHLSIMTSLNPPQFGITRRDGKNFSQERTTLRLAERVVTLPEVLSDHGYRTAAFTDGGLVLGRYGLDQGFDHFEANGYDGTRWHSGMKLVISNLTRYLERLPSDDRPLFLFLHTYEIHDPYSAPPPFQSFFTDSESEGTYDDFTRTHGFVPRQGPLEEHRSRLTQQEIAWVRGLYDNGIRAADSMIGNLVERLRSHRLYDSAHFVVLSDHGEEFDDHGRFGHGPSVYRELASVPLIWRLPGGKNGGAVREGPVALLDVAPTLLDVVGIPVPVSFEGRSLAGLLEGEDVGEWMSERRIYTDTPNLFFDVAGLRRGRWKVVRKARTGAVEVYDLAEDPKERWNLIAEKPAIAQRMLDELLFWRTEMADGALRTGTLAVEAEGQQELSQAEQEQLRALGYLE
jgi:arylsulfatase A-like enzyme